MSSPSVPIAVHAARRRAFLDRIGPTAAAVLPAAPPAVRSNDVEYVYRQDSDVLYLTGFPEPEGVCVLVPGRPQGEFVLFVRPRDPDRETWTGRRAGVEGAVATYGADAAYPVDELDGKVNDLIGDRDVLYYPLGRDAALNERVLGWMRQWRQLRPRQGSGPTALHDPAEILHDMRLTKDAHEVACLERAMAISAAAHLAAMRETRPGQYEYEVEALVDYAFRRHGASGPAYPSIVATGDNATVLHYTTNDSVLRDGDLLLIDAGAEYAGYCADITRTFPVGRRFSDPQRALYDVVLRAQLAAIEAVRPGAHVDEPHARALEVLVDGLLALGLLHGDRAAALADARYRRFYMHRTSHWLGLDVHDVGKYRVDGQPRALAPGMVLTIEPGLYVPADDPDVDPVYRGIGIRIEDDVLVTAEGHAVLSAAVPKSADAIESLRAGAA